MQLKQKFTLKNIGLVLLTTFVLMQFFRIDKTNPPLDPANDFISITKPSAEIASILKASCYDCHSNEIRYPWYTNIAPFSWWIKHHVNEGNEELNFSEWGTYKPRRMDHKLKEGIEMIEEDKMPLYSYTVMHGDAKLSAEQKEKLIAFFKGLRTGESDKPRD
jgi:hypothetical protein